jgi:hypothetical protein
MSKRARNVTVFAAKKIITMDRGRPDATAGAVMDSKILSVGSMKSNKPWINQFDYKVSLCSTPKLIADRATFKEPNQTAAGMKHVLVNGTFLIRDEQLDTEAFPGRALRRPVTA